MSLIVDRVHFPGALSSKFTTNLAFEHPATHPAMPTYRVMDSDGIIVDRSRKPAGISDGEVIQWYKDMLTGMDLSYQRTRFGGERVAKRPVLGL